MFWIFIVIWIASSLIFWVCYAIADNWGANWSTIIEDYEPLDIIFCITPIINTLFLLFLIISTIWKLLRISIFNKSFYSDAFNALKEIWKS
jgi:hypothetical protein